MSDSKDDLSRTTTTTAVVTVYPKDNDKEDTLGPKTPFLSVHSAQSSSLTVDDSATTTTTTIVTQPHKHENTPPTTQQYRLYKRRWLGIVALVFLNIVKGMNWVWFGSIAKSTVEEFGFDSLSQVNWFGNVPHFTYLAFSWCVPVLVRRFGLRNTALFGSMVLLLSGWIRFIGSLRSLSSNGSYAAIMVAQLLVGIVAPCFQVIGPRYAEVWFDLKGRATATMIVAISDPLGTAVGQIVAPFLAGDTAIRSSLLYLAIITSAASPLAFLVLAKPPTPPTYAGSLTSPPLAQTLRAAINKSRPGEQIMTKTERIDFYILFFVFGVLIAGTSSFSVFISQIFGPHGYSEATSGILGAAFLLSGLLAAILSAPLFDRVLINHLAKTVRFALPLLGAAWISLIFVVKPNNLAGIYVVLIAIAAISFILLPVGLELGVEITRSAETSTAVLWSGGNFVSILWVLAMDALRAPKSANPPENMKQALIFNAAFIAATASLVFFFTGAQTRRKLDEEKLKEAESLQL